ncbi:hypothetical protein [Maricaulis sp.]|uniref:hypothetical protein n=1 Tax=Maricaulis sp. TaxID=1486257 RepID=UPI002635D400|nr:hypothetical protein [Maricaulis sp.]MDF1769851.1 hypothetical protein [Maricaulis sp.]
MTPALKKVFKAREILAPAGARAIKHKRSPSVVYIYEYSGAPCAVAFNNRQTRPAWRYRFRDDAERARKVAAFFESAERNADYKKKSTSADNSAFQVGHILSNTWGYSMTLVDFYEVVGLRGRTIVQLRELKSTVVSGDAGYQGTLMPCPGEYAGEMFERRINGRTGHPGVKISDGQGSASLWDGKPKYYNRMD